MNPESPVIEIQNLVRRYGRHDAVNGLSLSVRPGRCYGFFSTTFGSIEIEVEQQRGD